MKSGAVEESLVVPTLIASALARDAPDAITPSARSAVNACTPNPGDRAARAFFRCIFRLPPPFLPAAMSLAAAHYRQGKVVAEPETAIDTLFLFVRRRSFVAEFVICIRRISGFSTLGAFGWALDRSADQDDDFARRYRIMRREARLVGVFPVREIDDFGGAGDAVIGINRFDDVQPVIIEEEGVIPIKLAQFRDRRVGDRHGPCVELA